MAMFVSIVLTGAGSFPHWGDVPTWIYAVVALGALIAAFVAYTKQTEAVRKQTQQLELQRQQLVDQQTANSTQAEVVAAQLREMAQRAVTFERQQADAIVVAPKKWSGEVLGVRDRSGPYLHMAMVHNTSLRPIRNVACRLQVTATGDMIPASVSGPSALAGFAIAKQSEDPSVRLVRASARAGFIFALEAESDPDAEIMARFTDDAGLHWQIDPDLHLAKLDSRDW